MEINLIEIDKLEIVLLFFGFVCFAHRNVFSYLSNVERSGVYFFVNVLEPGRFFFVLVRIYSL